MAILASKYRIMCKYESFAISSDYHSFTYSYYYTIKKCHQIHPKFDPGTFFVWLYNQLN